MTGLLTSVSQQPPLVALGWALLAALWATTVVGVLLAIWRLVNPRASAAHHHAAAVLAFCAALIVAPMAPVALQAWPTPVRPAALPGDASRALPPALEAATSDGDPIARAGGPTADQLVTPDVGATQSRLCRDDRDRGYSPGALVAIRNEPGRVARCDSGRWVEDTAGR
jgi:hypothetical protein